MSKLYSETVAGIENRLGLIVKAMHEDKGESLVTRVVMREHTKGYSKTKLIRGLDGRWWSLEHIEKEFK